MAEAADRERMGSSSLHCCALNSCTWSRVASWRFSTNRFLCGHRYSVGTKHNSFFLSIEANDGCDLCGEIGDTSPARIDGQQLIESGFCLTFSLCQKVT